MILITNVTTIQFYPPKVTEQVDIVIDNDCIKEVGYKVADKYKDLADKVINGNGCAILPGLVCSHNHYYSCLSRGILLEMGPTSDFISILKNLWWRLDKALDEESIYYSALIGAIEAIKCGTTATIDHHSSPKFIEGSLDIIRKAFETAGIRGMTCYEVTNRNAGMAEINAGIKENIRYIKQIEDDKDSGKWSGISEAAVGAHAPFTIPDEGLILLKDAIVKTERGIHIHVAEDRYDASHSHDIYNRDVIQRLNDFGLINHKSILVHGVYLSKHELELINSQDAFLIHNARSNMNNNVGYNRYLPIVNNIALGTDGIGSDMFEELKFAYFKCRDIGFSPEMNDYLGLMFNGNTILERYYQRTFGKIEKGYAADLTMIDYKPPTPLVNENIAGHMLFGISSKDVKTVIINGNIVMEDRKFPFDITGIYAESKRIARKLWDKI